MTHPSYGCNRLEAMLALEGVRLSAITIQKLLNDHHLGSRYDRWLALETRNAGTPIALTGEQVAFLEKQNPCFRERHVESGAPGELLCADTFFVGSLKGVGKVYLHAAVDTYQRVDEVSFQAGWSDRMLTAKIAASASVATRSTTIIAPSDATRPPIHARPRAWNSRGVPAPVSRRMINPRLYPAT
jgi:hypothetical protein